MGAVEMTSIELEQEQARLLARATNLADWLTVCVYFLCGVLFGLLSAIVWRDS